MRIQLCNCHLFLPSISTLSERSPSRPEISWIKLSYKSRNTRRLRWDRFCSLVMALCWRLRSLNLSSPSSIGHTVRCLLSKLSRSGLRALSSGARYTTGIPGELGDSANITLSLAGGAESEVDSEEERFFVRDRRVLAEGAGEYRSSSLSRMESLPPQCKDWDNSSQES